MPTNTHTMETDLFGPLRTSTPPITVGQVRTMAATRTSKRGLFYSSIAGIGIAIVTAIALFNPSTPSHHPIATPASTHMTLSTQSSSSFTAIARPAATPTTSKSTRKHINLPSTTATSLNDNASILPLANNGIVSSENNTMHDVDTSSRTETVATAAPSNGEIRTTHKILGESEDHWFGAAQFGTIMGALNSTGGGFALTATHDWMQATLRYTSTFGTASSDLFVQPLGKTASQDVREYALMFGARLQQGDFWASLEAGPNVIHASFKTLLTYPRQDTLWNEIGGGLGASAQATFGYKFSERVGMDLTGFVSNHSLTYGGILLSLVIGDL